MAHSSRGPTRYKRTVPGPSVNGSSAPCRESAPRCRKNALTRRVALLHFHADHTKASNGHDSYTLRLTRLGTRLDLTSLPRRCRPGRPKGAHSPCSHSRQLSVHAHADTEHLDIVAS